MAVIPLQVAGRPLETGRPLSYPDSSPVADAASRLGGAVQEAGARAGQIGERIQQAQETADARYSSLQARAQQQQDELDAFHGRLQESELSALLGQQEDEVVQRAPADGSGVHDAMYGQVDAVTHRAIKPGLFDKTFDDYKKRMPLSQQKDFELKREVYRAQGSGRMAARQYAHQQEFYKLKIEQSQDDVINGIMQSDPNDAKTLDAFKKQQIDLINASGLDNLTKQAWVDKFKGDAAEAIWKARVANDPVAAKAALGMGDRAPGGNPIDRVVNKIIGAESGGNPNAQNPNSSAGGLGQFIDSTWVSTIRRHRPDIAAGKSAQQIIALKKDPNLNKEMTRALTQDSAEFLTNRGIPATEGNLYLAHFLGEQGAANVLKADPNAPIASVIGQDKVNANPHLQGMTVADTIAWAGRKMGGQGGADQQYADIPPDRREVLANYADQVLRERNAENRAAIEISVQNAPAAIQNSGRYDGYVPGPESFAAAYGPEEGAQRHAQFQASMETSRQVYDMRSMPAGELNALVKASAPTSSGNTAALDQANYNIKASAAEQILKAREADPAAYVRNVFPAVDAAWKAVPPGGDISTALAQTAAAQDQLQIQNKRLLPEPVVKTAVDAFKDEQRGQSDRLTPAIGLLFATQDPEQRKAIFDQMVDAGLPDITEGAVRALERGDRGAANRLFTAAMTDPSKLPGASPVKQSEIDEAVQTAMFDEGKVGDLFYGLTHGSTDNYLSAQRDSKLFNNAVLLAVRGGATLDAAIASVGQDMYGKVKAVTDTHAQILLPVNAKAQPTLDGLRGLLPQVKKQVTNALSPTDPLSQAGRQYPIIRNSRMAVTKNPAMTGNVLEFWPAGEEGAPDAPRPKDLPLDQPGVELGPNATPRDVAADIVSHHLVNTDPELKPLYKQFSDEFFNTDQGKARLKADYAEAQAAGETRDIVTWANMDRIPAYFRGHVFNQWPGAKLETVLTPTQMSALDSMGAIVRRGAGGSSSIIRDTAVSNYADRITAEGYFRDMAGGYVFINPYTGMALPGEDGKPRIYTEKDFVQGPPVPGALAQPVFETGSERLQREEQDTSRQNPLPTPPPPPAATPPAEPGTPLTGSSYGG